MKKQPESKYLVVFYCRKNNYIGKQLQIISIVHHIILTGEEFGNIVREVVNNYIDPTNHKGDKNGYARDKIWIHLGYLL